MIDGYAFSPSYQMPQMAGPSGFAGGFAQSPSLGGMFGAQKKGGMNPALLMGLIPGLLAQHPGYALPALGGLAGVGLYGLLK
jgi:hypothetical protein